MQFEAQASFATELYLLIQRGSKRAAPEKNAPNAYVQRYGNTEYRHHCPCRPWENNAD